MALTVTEKLVLSDGKQDLVLPQKEVSGLEFVCLEKWNRQLVKMVTGKALDLRPVKASESGSLKAKVWDEIVEERQKVANQKLQEALEVDNGQAQDAQAARGAKKNKVVRAGSKHMLMLPEVIDIDCRQHGLKVLLEGINTQVIWMHFTEDNINWLKNEVGAEEAKPRAKRRSGRKRTRGDSSEDHEDEPPQEERQNEDL